MRSLWVYYLAQRKRIQMENCQAARLWKLLYKAICEPTTEGRNIFYNPRLLFVFLIKSIKEIRIGGIGCSTYIVFMRIANHEVTCGSGRFVRQLV